MTHSSLFKQPIKTEVSLQFSVPAFKLFPSMLWCLMCCFSSSLDFFTLQSWAALHVTVMSRTSLLHLFGQYRGSSTNTQYSQASHWLQSWIISAVTLMTNLLCSQGTNKHAGLNPALPQEHRDSPVSYNDHCCSVGMNSCHSYECCILMSFFSDFIFHILCLLLWMLPDLCRIVR